MQTINLKSKKGAAVILTIDGRTATIELPQHGVKEQGSLKVQPVGIMVGKVGVGLSVDQVRRVVAASREEESAIIAREQAVRQAERLAIRATVPGYTELAAARRAWEQYEAARDRQANSMREDAFLRMPQAPAESLADTEARYPQAAFWMLTEDYRYKHNDRYATAGRRAVARLESGEDWQTVKADFDEEIDAVAATID